MSEVFDSGHAKVMSAIVLWAYENDIEIRFFKVRDYSDISYPKIMFTKNDSHIETAFWPLCNDGEYAKSICRDIGYRLCVSVPRFL